MTSRRLDRAFQSSVNLSVRHSVPKLEVPNIMDFALSRHFLNLEFLYPLQALLLKLMFLQPELLTLWDHEQLERFTSGWKLPDGMATEYGYQGEFGIVPDVLDRVERCRAEGRPWFHEVVMVLGRRAGKGFLGSIAAAYVLWHYLAFGDPQAHFGIDATKPLVGMVFAGKREQARANQFADIQRRIEQGPCFKPFLVDSTMNSVTLWSPRQKAAGSSRWRVPAFEINARESSNLGGRGPTSFMQCYDEMAHMVPQGVSRGAAEVYDAATPALAQFGVYGWIYEASSPAYMTGQFFRSYRDGLALDPATMQATSHEIFVTQLPTRVLYDGWEQTR